MSLNASDQWRQFGQECPLALRLKIVESGWWSGHKRELELITDDISDENWTRVTDVCDGLHMQPPLRPTLQTAMLQVKKTIEAQCKFLEECEQEFADVSDDGALTHLYTQEYQLTVLEPDIQFPF
jgi:hypothetical protein